MKTTLKTTLKTACKTTAKIVMKIVMKTVHIVSTMTSANIAVSWKRMLTMK